MSRRLDDLSPEFKPIAFEFLARLTEAQVPVLIIDTLRTPEEQAENVAKGVSAILNSKHLVGDAIDVCPFMTYALHGPDKLQWDASDPVWKTMGEVGEKLGLRWGGRWVRPHDPGHFEYIRKRQVENDTGSDVPGGGAG